MFADNRIRWKKMFGEWCMGESAGRDRSDRQFFDQWIATRQARVDQLQQLFSARDSWSSW